MDCFVYRWEKSDSVVILNYEIKTVPTLINHTTVSITDNMWSSVCVILR